MKRYVKILFFFGVLFIGCTPEVQELRTLKVEEIKKPKVVPPAVDLTKTVVVFNTKETVDEIYRNPIEKTIDSKTYKFAPEFAKRKLETGESIKVRLVPKETNIGLLYLSQDTYTVEIGEITSGTNEKFVVNLKTDAFKDATKYVVDREYVLSFGLEVVEATPKDLPMAGVEDAVFQIKIKLTEFSFPEGNNIQVDNSISGQRLTNFSFSSSYATAHLYKLTDRNNYTNWWVDTRENISLKAIFTGPTLVNGVKIKMPQGRFWEPKYLGGVDIIALPGKSGAVKKYHQGTYTRVQNPNNGELILKFIDPIEVKEIEFNNFKKGGDNFVDIYEIEFY